MSFRRIPFQFSSTDPVERQAELEKRFGLPSTRNNMHFDKANPFPLSMGSGSSSNESSSSPRLQHRVPIFMEGGDQPVKSSVDSVGFNPDTTRKPKVRVIPIEIEGADSRQPTRHRTSSGPAGWAKENEPMSSSKEESSPLKRSMQDLSQQPKMKVPSGPKIHNIPIKIEGRSSNSFRSPTKSEKLVKPSIPKKDHTTVNGCASSMPSKKVTPEKEQKIEMEEQNAEPQIEVPLKKICNVLEELKSYELIVKEFTGTVKDKQYRYLDEMLTRCMLRLDDIDTMGNDKVRSARKSAVKKVQASIDLLETKVNADSAVAGETEMNSVLQESHLPIDVDVKENAEASKEIQAESASQDQILEVEMVEDKDSKCEVQEATDVVSEMLASQEESMDVKNTNEIGMTDIEAPGKDPIVGIEVEMTEAKDIPSLEDNSSKMNKVPEVEMVESKSAKSENLADQFSGKVAEVDTSECIPSNNRTESKINDVDMEDTKDAQNVQENSADTKVSKSEECCLGESKINTDVLASDSTSYVCGSASNAVSENKCLKKASSEDQISTEL